MAQAQTDYINKRHVLRGACIYSIREYGSSGTFLNLGALDGCKITENLQITTQETQNVADEYALTDQTGTIEGSMFETMFEDAREIMRNGIDLTTNVPGTPVVGGTQSVSSGSWSYEQFIPFTNKNANGTVPTNITVTASVDGALVEGTDFFVMYTDADGWGFYVIDSATVTTETQDLALTMDYTPASAREVTSGGVDVLPFFELKVTQVYPDGLNVEWLFYKCQIGAGQEFEFKKYNDEDDRLMSPITINAILDTSRTSGDQLYKLTDYRSVA